MTDPGGLPLALRRHGRTAHGPARWAVGVLACCWLGCAAPVAGWPAKKPVEFKNAILAQDRKDWKGSIALLRKALEAQPEDGQLVRIYGTKYKSYVPHYYLGLALSKQGDCAAAITEWELSLEVGAVQATSEYEALLAALVACRAAPPRSTSTSSQEPRVDGPPGESRRPEPARAQENDDATPSS